jgi:hypothetical protein
MLKSLCNFQPLTIKQCVNDEPAVLLHEVVDVTEDSTEQTCEYSSPLRKVEQSLPHDGQKRELNAKKGIERIKIVKGCKED